MTSQVRTADVGITQDGDVELYVPPNVTSETNIGRNITASLHSPQAFTALTQIPTGTWSLVWREDATSGTFYPVTGGTP